MQPTALPSQLRACAKWHERQARRNPERSKHHNRIAARLYRQALDMRPLQAMGVKLFIGGAHEKR